MTTVFASICRSTRLSASPPTLLHRVAALRPTIPRRWHALLALAAILLGAAGPGHAADPVPNPPKPGVWWNKNASGRGFFIDGQGGKVAVAAFLYEPGDFVTAKPTWFTAVGTLSVEFTPPGLSFSRLRAPILIYRGGQTLTGAYRPAMLNDPPGMLQVDFTSAETATVTWPGGTTEEIARFGIGPNGTVLPPNFAVPGFGPATGVWWNPDEGGRAFTLDQQGDTLMVGGYMYDDSGSPVWYISASAPIQVVHGIDTLAAVYSGNWQEYGNGQAMGAPYVAPQLINANVGSYVFRLSTVLPSAPVMRLTLPDGRVIPLVKFFSDAVPF